MTSTEKKLEKLRGEYWHLIAEGNLEKARKIAVKIKALEGLAK